MSTTTRREVALGYMAQPGAAASGMLLAIRMGMVDRGADVHFLSQFPNEEEILFAPLTGLEVVAPPVTMQRLKPLDRAEHPSNPRPS